MFESLVEKANVIVIKREVYATVGANEMAVDKDDVMSHRTSGSRLP